MYIIAIGWVYVTVLMAATEPSLLAGVVTFIFWGVLPTALMLWLFSMPTRRRLRQQRELVTEQQNAENMPPKITPTKSEKLADQ